MKRNLLFGFAVILLMFGVNGCCKQFWPEQIVFTPEVKMEIDKEIERLEIKNPVILVVGQEGTTFAVTQDGNAYTPCRPPEELYHEDEKTPDEKGRQGSTDAKKDAVGAVKIVKEPDLGRKTAINKKDLPVCRGFNNIKKILRTSPITIMDARKNPYCRVVRDPYGGYQERCYP